MQLFDWHCDTLTEIYQKGESLRENTCAVSLSDATVFSHYTQVFAVFSDPRYTDEENYGRFDAILDYAEKDLHQTPSFTPILSVEGGRLLGHDIGRLDHIFARGVRIFHPVWQDISRIGGAWNTDLGLTAFGREAVEKCFSLGMVIDLSHASDQMFSQIIEIAKSCGGQVIAGHSCARALCSHRRNLTDEMAKQIGGLGGIIGVNFVIEHLGGNTVERVVEHILHLASASGRDHICLGSDFDGTDRYPSGLSHLRNMPILWDAISKRTQSEDFADRCFCANAQKFFDQSFVW